MQDQRFDIRYVKLHFCIEYLEDYGKEQARYIIHSVSNTTGQSILFDNDVQMENYQVKTVADYVDYRMGQMRKIFDGKL